MLRFTIALLFGILTHQVLADEPERIVGGIDAESREFPYHCSINYDDLYFCGCSILSENKILTAGHCVPDADLSLFSIRTGSIGVKQGNKHYVKRAKVHPNYEESKEASWINDIAVITLNASIIFDDNQRPVKLASTPPQPGDECVFTGWGRKSRFGDSPPYLLKMNAALVSNEVCDKGYKIKILPSQVCALNKVGIGICKGDSGGPLVCKGEQYGISSFVMPCARGIPDVFTKVYHYREFIKQEMDN